MANTQLKTHVPSHKSTEINATQFKMLQELDLRSLTDHDAVANNQHNENELSENISYSLGLLSYAVGLFAIAYWVLVAQHAWLIVAGLLTIGVGIKLFLSPIQFFKKKLSASSLKQTQIDMDNEFDEFDEFHLGTKF